MKLTFVTVSATAVKRLCDAAERLNRALDGAIELSVYYAIREFDEERTERMVSDLSSADFAFVDLMGTPPALLASVTEGLDRCMGDILPYGNGAKEYLRLGSFTAEALKRLSGGKRNVKAMGGTQISAEVSGECEKDMRNYARIVKYFKIADAYNIELMLKLILRDYGLDLRIGTVEEPREVAAVSVCAPDGMISYESVSAYADAHGFSEDRATVAVLYYAHLYPTDTSRPIAEIVRMLEEKHNVLPIAVSGASGETVETLREILLKELSLPLDLILNFMSFRLGAGAMGGDAEAGTRLLSELDVPHLHPFFMSRRTVSDWKASAQGCSATEVMISLLMPELDGSINTIPVGAMSDPVSDPRFDVPIEEMTLIGERAERLVAMADRWITLRRKPNHEKRIALICYNYPPGEDSLFGGAFLDTFESVSSVVCRLKKEGYTTDALSVEDLKSHFTAGKAVNSGRYSAGADGMILYDSKKYTPPAEMLSVWGRAPGNVMSEGRNFLIPGMISGNVFIGLQPARNGEGGDTAAAYHDKTKPPHHQYVAFYQYLREEFRADAIVHVGTHGTLEFLKGKEAGMSGDCYPDLLIRDIPHIYLYYCGNPAEATVAKRRSHATLVGYQPPVFVEGGLYGDHAVLSAEMDNYRQALQIAPQTAPDILKRIMSLAEALNLPTDIEELESELYRMNHSLIPRGLHVFGAPYTDEECEEYLKGLRNYTSDGNADDEAVRNACRSNHEMQGLLDVLCGKYLPAKLAGDIYRNPAVLPSGYNLFQFDPKLVPTVTAYERGNRIACNTLDVYRQEYGTYPSSVAVVLWGLETSRTQGETFTQILSYLGVRLVTKGARGRSYEIIPLSELGRPRVDVTVNICGFFRDMYPNLIDTLSDLFEEVSSLDEPNDMNHVKAHTEAMEASLLRRGVPKEQARLLTASRIFGPAEGQYGSGITKFFQNHDWESEEEVGRAFTANVDHVYNRRMRGVNADGLYEEQLKCVDIVSQLRSSNEYEVTDLDHYFEYFGGLSKSVELARGRKAAMYITDTAGKELHTETVDRSIARGIRTRLLNPKWIDGMLAHSYHGGQKIMDRFENIMGFSATTGSVDEWIYNELDARYVEDESLRRRMIENNPHAYMKILEQMMEYSDRGYWDATEEQLEKIRECYLELENDLEGNL